ncbi:hypothetical protein PR048_032467 [Dryococelus australis]|uniref:FLYWCH-type domain-containing protein n=1 Tax=Dryococelus australis TaxID=614101 RepID=A0ABQ9G596_9NEOP|nr:hypothetical protein PR048_032467 [Dryococelus australis]
MLAKHKVGKFNSSIMMQLVSLLCIFPAGRVVQFVRSKRGNPLAVLDGYVYNKHVTKGSKTFWKCTSYDTTRSCRARLTTFGEVVYLIMGSHNHDPQYGNLLLSPPYHFFGLATT